MSRKRLHHFPSFCFSRSLESFKKSGFKKKKTTLGRQKIGTKKKGDCGGKGDSTDTNNGLFGQLKKKKKKEGKIGKIEFYSVRGYLTESMAECVFCGF